MKIIIAVDSFKGSLTSIEVGQSVSEGIKEIIPDCDIVIFPLSDGGEGLLGALENSIKGEHVEITVSDPIGRDISSYYYKADNKAVIEMALSGGLTLLNEKERNPAITDTRGLGQTIIHALNNGCNHFLIGIGGSATNDAGIGMLSELGYRFYDANGQIVNGGGGILSEIRKIDDSNVPEKIRRAKFTVACDVNNPFYGENGAAYVYAPQKGADEAMVKLLDNGLRNFADVVKEKNNIDLQLISGSGAAGGLGGAFVGLLGAELRSGIDLVLELLNFEKELSGADLVITGEGCIDKQTLQGKAPIGVLNASMKHNVPVIAIAGAVSDSDILLKKGFKDVVSVNPEGISLQQAMKPEIAKSNVKSTVRSILSQFVSYAHFRTV